MKTILIIEDNLDILENISELLELSDYRVINAKNGAEGVEEATGKLPDVILCDIMMPEVNGYEVLKIIKNNPSTANTPFIFVSASTEKKDVQAALDMGADGYLRKPFDSDELLNLIDGFIKA